MAIASYLPISPLHGRALFAVASASCNSSREISSPAVNAARTISICWLSNGFSGMRTPIRSCEVERLHLPGLQAASHGRPGLPPRNALCAPLSIAYLISAVAARITNDGCTRIVVEVQRVETCWMWRPRWPIEHLHCDVRLPTPSAASECITRFPLHPLGASGRPGPTQMEEICALYLSP